MRRTMVMMTRTLVVLLALAAFSAPALAQPHADVQVSITAPSSVAPEQPFTAHATVFNAGPDPAPEVEVYFRVHNVQCLAYTDIGTLAPGEGRQFDCSATATIADAPSYVASSDIFAQSSAYDPSQDDNAASVYTELITLPDLRGIAEAALPVAPGLPFPITVRSTNRARMTSERAVLTITTPTRFASVPDFCAGDEKTVRCTIGPLEAGAAFTEVWKQFEIEVVAPDASETPFRVDFQIAAAEGDANPANDRWTFDGATYRTFFVTNADNPGGSGSLTAAIHAANAACTDHVPCLIAFRIPVTPRSTPSRIVSILTQPLPIITSATVTIDGTTQTGYFGDLNPDGPEIELQGMELTHGRGIEMPLACRGGVRGLILNGFRVAALVLGTSNGCPQPEWTPRRIVELNYIGTDASGMTALPNRLGIHLDGANGGWFVRRNLISGNAGAGIRAEGGINTIENNTIGLNRDLSAGLGNGASGVYISARASGTDVNDNYLGFNQHAGVAIAADAQNVALHGNSFQANGGLAIDWGIDGISLTSPVVAPEITSARYENGYTILEGTTGAVGGTFGPTVQFYANDARDDSGYGEGQYFLGAVQQAPEFRFVYPGDLRGKWVSATNTRLVYNTWVRGPRQDGDSGYGRLTTTSEFGRAVEVK